MHSGTTPEDPQNTMLGSNAAMPPSTPVAAKLSNVRKITDRMGAIAADISQMSEETVGLVRASKRATLPAPTFDGNADVDSFLQQFVRIADFNDWSDEEACIRLQMAVVGPARQGITATTIEGICGQLRSRYRLSENGAAMLLKSLKWKANENIHEFAAYVQKLVNAAFPELDQAQRERRAIKELTNALPTSCHTLMWELRHRTPSSYEEVVELIKGFNELNVNPRINQVETDEVAVLRKEVASQATLIERMLANQEEMQKQILAALPKPRPRRDLASLTCYRCQQQGHIARNCTAKPVKPSENAQVQ